MTSLDITHSAGGVRGLTLSRLHNCWREEGGWAISEKCVKNAFMAGISKIIIFKYDRSTDTYIKSPMTNKTPAARAFVNQQLHKDLSA